MLVGIDEVGRGCWAGPLVAGAVLLHQPVPGLKDSKKLSASQRSRLDQAIRSSGAHIGLGWVTPREVDMVGLTESVRLAMQRALAQITVGYDEVIIDGHINFLLHETPNSRALIKADDTVPAVSAASIVAKVARDAYMTKVAEQFPGYGFERHVGYGTAAHVASLKALGVTELHRLSYKPIKALLQ